MNTENNTVTNNTNTNTKARGRAKGSTDSVLISVAELLRRYGSNAEIPVRRTWLVKQAVEAAKVAALEGTTAIPPVSDGDALPPNLEEVNAELEAEHKIALSVS